MYKVRSQVRRWAQSKVKRAAKVIMAARLPSKAGRKAKAGS